MSSEPQCVCCGKRPEVYGACWCAQCHAEIPERAKRRILELQHAWEVERMANSPKGDVVTLRRSGE